MFPSFADTGSCGRRVLIDTILKDMDLDHCRTTHVGGVESAYGVLIQGGLSSGERRRLQVKFPTSAT
jgi:hypothetical protein